MREFGVKIEIPLYKQMTPCLKLRKKKVLHISYFNCSDDGNYRPDPNRRNLLSMDAGLDDGYDRREGLLGRPRYV